jgi:hypothetical protein
VSACQIDDLDIDRVGRAVDAAPGPPSVPLPRISIIPIDLRALGLTNDRVRLKERLSDANRETIGSPHREGGMDSEAHRPTGPASAALKTGKGHEKNFRRKSPVTH